jgi:magnesium-transporting ATPase (P-type)
VVIAALQMVGAHNAGVDAVDALRFTLVIVTSFVPAGLVLAITVSLSAAAVRVGRHGTLVQRLSALESLGSLSVLCTDKTGTLTRNLLVVERIEPLRPPAAARPRRSSGSPSTRRAPPRRTRRCGRSSPASARGRRRGPSWPRCRSPPRASGAP